MARPSSYTADEDRIILETSNMNIAFTNKMLTAAGFEERTKSAITGRRQLLRRRGESDLDEVAMDELYRRQRNLKERLISMVQQFIAVTQEITERNARERADADRLIDLMRQVELLPGESEQEEGAGAA